LAEEPTTTPAEEQDTSAEEAAPDQEGTPAEPEEGKPEGTDDWEKRYGDLQPEYTRATQRLSEYEQLFQAAQQGNPDALAALGLEPAGGDDEEEYLDDTERLQQQIAELQQRLDGQDQERQSAAYQEQEDTATLEALTQLEQKDNVELSNEEVELVLGNALAKRNDDGTPDVNGAYKALRAAQKLYQEKYVESKRAPKVAVGSAGEEKIDFSNEEQRRAYMVRQVDALMESDE
jgi:hypothetical protein